MGKETVFFKKNWNRNGRNDMNNEGEFFKQND